MKFLVPLFSIGALALPFPEDNELSRNPEANGVRCTSAGLEEAVRANIPSGSRFVDYLINHRVSRNNRNNDFGTALCKAAPWQGSDDPYNFVYDPARAGEFADSVADNEARAAWILANGGTESFPAGAGGHFWCNENSGEWHQSSSHTTPACPHHDVQGAWQAFFPTQYTSTQYTSTPYTPTQWTSTQYTQTEYTQTEYTQTEYTQTQYTYVCGQSTSEPPIGTEVRIVYDLHQDLSLTVIGENTQLALKGQQGDNDIYIVRPPNFEDEGVSFESKAHGGRFLRHRGTIIYAHAWNSYNSYNPELFMKDSTWSFTDMSNEFTNDGAISFRAQNYPEYYINPYFQGAWAGRLALCHFGDGSALSPYTNVEMCEEMAGWHIECVE